jgi:hypothetical protein
MKQQDNQSIVIKAINDIALEDLSVQNAEAIKGGPNELINDFVAQDKYVTGCASNPRLLPSK